MNIFDRIISQFRSQSIQLGRPAKSEHEFVTRMNTMANMTSGNGFIQPSKKERISARGRRLRERAAKWRAGFIEFRNKPVDQKFLNSHALQMHHLKELIERQQTH